MTIIKSLQFRVSESRSALTFSQWFHINTPKSVGADNYAKLGRKKICRHMITIVRLSLQTH